MKLEAAHNKRALDQDKIVNITPIDSDVQISLRSGAQIRDDGKNITLHNGKMTPQIAETMIAAAKAHGQDTVTVRGDQATKEMLAAAAFKAGIDVKNPEMAEYIAGLAKREQRNEQTSPAVQAQPGPKATASERVRDIRNDQRAPDAPEPLGTWSTTGAERPPRESATDWSTAASSQLLRTPDAPTADRVKKIDVAEQHVDIVFGNGTVLRDQGDQIALEKGHLGHGQADVMIKAAQAHGWTSITVVGTESQKRTVAEAAFRAGMKVDNAELQQFMAELAEEQTKKVQASIRPAQQQQHHHQHDLTKTAAAIAARVKELTETGQADDVEGFKAAAQANAAAHTKGPDEKRAAQIEVMARGKALSLAAPESAQEKGIKTLVKMWAGQADQHTRAPTQGQQQKRGMDFS